MDQFTQGIFLGLLDMGSLAISPFIIRRFDAFNMGLLIQILIILVLGLKLGDVLGHGGQGKNII
jgi:hypothetical protein